MNADRGTPEMPRRDRAVLELRQMILAGALPGGTRLSEPMLAERLKVSRTPVRAALAALSHEGLVEARPGGGYRIRTFSEADIFDAIELRGTYEGLCARYAAERRPSAAALYALAESIAAIDAVLARSATPGDDDLLDYMEHNRRLHESIVALARSAVLAEATQRIVNLPFASPSAFVRAHAHRPESRRVLEIAQHQHHSLHEAIAAGEGGRAEAIAREHARSAKRNLQIVLGRRDGERGVPGLQLIKRA